MSIDKNGNGNNDTSVENDPEKRENIDLDDHPGLQKMNINPNPRANENISGSETTNDTGSNVDDRTDEVGSEITDGEAG